MFATGLGNHYYVLGDCHGRFDHGLHDLLPGEAQDNLF